MQLRSKGCWAILAAAGVYLAGLAAPQPAFAHEKHHRHHHVVHTASRKTASYATPAPDASSGFGPTASGVSSILVDASSGQVISAQGADTPRYPASLTKLMTLDLAFQALAAGRMTLDTQIPISDHATSVEPVKLGLRAGDSISVHDAVLAMTTMSANDAATALGEYLGGGSEARCAQMMTLRAHALGMAQTEFANASGLPNPNQVTTARDLSLLARDIVLNYPQFQSFFEVTSFNFRGRTVFSNNQMLKRYAGATGMKTGYTNLAQHNLVTSASRNGKGLIGVVLHEPSWGNAYTQMTAMLDGGFGGHVPMTQNMVAAANNPAAPPAENVASRTPARAVPLPDSTRQAQSAAKHWVAQLGVFKYKTTARMAALKARELHGHGIAQIQHVQRGGKALWLAQLTGLTYNGAHDTCRAMNAHGHQCDVQPLQADHLAMLNGADGT